MKRSGSRWWLGVAFAVLGISACGDSETHPDADADADVPAEAEAEVAADADADGDVPGEGEGEGGADGDADEDVPDEAEAETGEDVPDEAEAETGEDVPDEAEAETGEDVPAEAEAETGEDVPAEAEAEAGADADAGPPPECTAATGCTLHTDCCDCLALGPGDPGTPCGIPECFVTTCTGRGITSADLACGAGRCAAYDCDESAVTCSTPKPSCASGELPAVRTGCWGACVPADQCRSVSGCTACPAATHFCVRTSTGFAVTAHCVPIIPGCGAAPTCACAGSSVCVSPTDFCVDAPEGLTCECPTCV